MKWAEYLKILKAIQSVVKDGYSSHLALFEYPIYHSNVINLVRGEEFDHQHLRIQSFSTACFSVRIIAPDNALRIHVKQNFELALQK